MSSWGVCPPYLVRYQDLAARTLPYLSFPRSGSGGCSLTGRGNRLPSPATLVCVGLGSSGSPWAVRAAGSVRLQPRTRRPLPHSVAHVGWGGSLGGGGATSGLVATWGRGQGSCWVRLLGGVRDGDEA